MLVDPIGLHRIARLSWNHCDAFAAAGWTLACSCPGTRLAAGMRSSLGSMSSAGSTMQVSIVHMLDVPIVTKQMFGAVEALTSRIPLIVTYCHVVNSVVAVFAVGSCHMPGMRSSCRTSIYCCRACTHFVQNSHENHGCLISRTYQQRSTHQLRLYCHAGMMGGCWDSISASLAASCYQYQASSANASLTATDTDCQSSSSNASLAASECPRDRSNQNFTTSGCQWESDSRDNSSTATAAAAAEANGHSGGRECWPASWAKGSSEQLKAAMRASQGASQAAAYAKVLLRQVAWTALVDTSSSAESSAI